MNQDLSILHLVLNASIVVQLVMVLLVVVSVASWAAIFRKLFALKRIKALNESFEREFWSGTSLNDLYAAAAKNARDSGPMERIFASGLREYQKLRERHITDTGTLMDGARRAMRASVQREMDEVELSALCLEHLTKIIPGAKEKFLGANVLRTPLGSLVTASAPVRPDRMNGWCPAMASNMNCTLPAASSSV